MRDDYVPNLKIPGRRSPSRRMWLAVALCVLFPPVGLILLWGGVRCPIRGKVSLTFLSVALMTGALTLFLLNQNQDQPLNLVTQPPAVQMYGQATPTPQPTAAPAPGDSAGQAQPEALPEALPEGVIPANPMS